MKHKYPITRTQLHNMPSIIQAEMRNMYIDEIVEDISNQIIQDAANTKKVCEILINQYKNRNSNIYMEVRDGSFDLYMNIVINKLKLRFPECVFTQDPTKKYLFIDWH